MEMKLSFLGATRNVTGSKYLLEANGSRVLIDCGMYQEWKLKSRNWLSLPVPPESLDAVVLTHAHLDHCGLVPKLVSDGFHGKIYCTRATAAIAKIVLLDSAHLQQEDARFKARRHRKEGRKGPHPEVPLYTVAEAEDAIPLLNGIRYGEVVTLGEGIEATFHDAGHILGASMIKIKVSQGGVTRSIIFSGDVGRANKPILRDPTFFDQADYVVTESTYGDRTHEDPKDVNEMLADVINQTNEAGGNILIPAFAIGRSQEILYRLNELLIADKIPHLSVFVDSPMAIKVTDVFRQHPHLFDEEMIEMLQTEESPFDFHNLRMTRTASESKAINHIRGTVVIMAGSGMCTGGRIKHHLVQNIHRPESSLLIVGYQAEGTLGGNIVRGAKRVRILGQEYRVRAKVTQIHGFSAHADRDELVTWLQSLKNQVRHVFVTHGDEDAALSFVDHLKEKTGWKVTAPTLNEAFTLD